MFSVVIYVEWARRMVRFIEELTEEEYGVFFGRLYDSPGAGGMARARTDDQTRRSGDDNWYQKSEVPVWTFLDACSMWHR